MATFDSTTQLSFFDPVEPQFSERIRRTENKGETLYSLVDIMREFSESENEARVYWAQTKKRLKRDGFELYHGVKQLKLPSVDGKTYSTDVANAETCMRIVQSIPSPKAEPIRMWLAHIGFERLEEARTPGLASQRARQRDLSALKRAGYGEHEAVKRLEIRVDGIETFKSMMRNVGRICEHPNYGQLVDTEYLYLFEQVSADLKQLLNSKSVRDSLPTLQLSYLRTAELSMDMLLSQKDKMSMPEILSVAQLVAQPLGDNLRMISAHLGRHPVTGQSLLQ